MPVNVVSAPNATTASSVVTAPVVCATVHAGVAVSGSWR